MNNVILTGVPRAGTTLACFLLNRLPNVVALHEPIADWGEQSDPQLLCDQIDHFFAESRTSLIHTGTALSKQVDGKVPDNPKSEYPLFSRLQSVLRRRPTLRRSIVARGTIQIGKPLTHDFLLCIKHNGHFTVLLAPLLARGYRCYAIIRHPLAVLASWNSIDFAPYHGRMFAAERLDPVLARQLDRIDDRFARQIHLLNWFFETFYNQLPVEQIIRYEEIVASRGAALHRIAPVAHLLDEPLENKNGNRLYDQALMRKLSTRLEQTDGAFWHFYARERIADDCVPMVR